VITVQKAPERTPKKYRILFFSCEPGGAEVLIPVIRLLQSQLDCEVVVASYGYGLDRFQAKGVGCRTMAKLVPGELGLLNEVAPHLLITSATSLPEQDMTERYLWLGARTLHIPSIAFLDQWQNYALRFSGCGKDEYLAYLPDYINCINGFAEREMLQEGFEAGRLKKFGHPYLSSLSDAYDRTEHKEEIAKRLNLPPNKPVALFVSEAIREHFGLSRGYDQFGALNLFFQLLKTSLPEHVPVIKLHPKDKVEEYQQYFKTVSDKVPCVITDELNSLECIKLANQVFGMTSIMLIEAYILGKPVVSLQPGLVGKNHLILSRIGITPTFIETPEGAKLFAPKPKITSEPKFSFAFDEEAFLTFMYQLLDK
jgi:hypothetical protein